MLRRWHWKSGDPPTDVPFVASARVLDIPNTLVSYIRNAEPNCVAIAIRYAPLHGTTGRTVADCERAARHKGLRLLWVRMRGALLEPLNPLEDGK